MPLGRSKWRNLVHAQHDRNRTVAFGIVREGSEKVLFLNGMRRFLVALY